VKLKLLTWNIAFGCGRNNGGLKANLNWAFLPNKNKKLIDEIGELIKEQNPDIACLQEINLGSKKNGKLNQASEIQKVTRLKNVHQASDTVIPFYLKLSNVVFTKLKPIKTTLLDLPKIIFTRKANVVEFDKFIVINAHLSTMVSAKLSKYIRASRPWQIRELIKIVNNRKKPIIICGDLNCSEESKEFRELMEKTDLQQIKTENTYTSWNSTYRLDHVLVTPEIKLKKTIVLKSNLSDHLPVVSEMEL